MFSYTSNIFLLQHDLYTKWIHKYYIIVMIQKYDVATSTHRQKRDAKLECVKKDHPRPLKNTRKILNG